MLKKNRRSRRTWRKGRSEDHHRTSILCAVKPFWGFIGLTQLQEPHRHPGVFVGHGKEDYLLTRNITPGESVYGEKRISVENAAQPSALTNGANVDLPATKVEYRVWNPFRSKLAAGILGGLDDIFVKPGAKVLYLGAASGTSVSHVADIVGPQGIVFAVEFSDRSGRDLINSKSFRSSFYPFCNVSWVSTLETCLCNSTLTRERKCWLRTSLQWLPIGEYIFEHHLPKRAMLTPNQYKCYPHHWGCTTPSPLPHVRTG